MAYLLFEGRPLTTRGRWINPLVFAAHRLWPVLPLAQRDPAPIFILGVGRSGTTVLGTILALHKDVGYLNEPKALWHAALGNDDLLGSYGDAPGRYRHDARSAHPRAARQLRHSYSAFLRLARCRRIVDKYPELIFRTELLNAVFPAARKVVLIRNGNDTCRSIQRWSQANGLNRADHVDDWWGRDRRKWRILVEELVAPNPIFTASLGDIRAFDRHLDMAAVEWIVTMREVLRQQAQGDRNLLIMRYEDLLASPGKALNDILDFCDLAPDPVLLDYARNTLRRQTAHTIPRLHPAIQGVFDQTMDALDYLSKKAA